MNEEKNLKRFADFARAHSSIYLTREDRQRMMLDLYQVERGYSESEQEYESASKIYAPFLAQVSQKLSSLVISQNKKYDWESFLSNFANRESGADFADVLARDILLIEKTIEMYNGLRAGSVNYDSKFSNEVEKIAFKVALILYDKDHENYTV